MATMLFTASCQEENIAGINADEFPDTYDFEISDSIIIESKVLKDMIRQSIFAASKDTFRQI